MEQPEGFVQYCSIILVCKLMKSLYGLRQSPGQWYKNFDSFMVSQNFIRSKYDHCVFFKSFSGIFTIRVLYVDDMLIVRKSMGEIKRLKAHLSRTFDMKDLGAKKHILGMEIHRDRKNVNLWLSQQKYWERVLEKFGVNNVKPVNVPLASHLKISLVLSPRTNEEKQYMSHVPYTDAVGNLMYVMVSIRPNISHEIGVVSKFMKNPSEEHWGAVKWVLQYLRGTSDHYIIFNCSDISHAVGVVSRFMENPGEEHWPIVKWVFQYLRGTSDHCIIFNGSEGSVYRYVDVDYAGDLHKRRSITRYVFTLAGGAISWMSKLQETIVLSTTKAKYIAASDTNNKAIWLRVYLMRLEGCRRE